MYRAWIDRSNLTIWSARLPLGIRTIVGCMDPLTNVSRWHSDPVTRIQASTFSYEHTATLVAPTTPRSPRVRCVHGQARIGSHRYRSNTEDSEAARAHVPLDRDACCTSPLPTKYSWISRFRCFWSPSTRETSRVLCPSRISANQGSRTSLVDQQLEFVKWQRSDGHTMLAFGHRVFLPSAINFSGSFLITKELDCFERERALLRAFITAFVTALIYDRGTLCYGLNNIVVPSNISCLLLALLKVSIDKGIDWKLEYTNQTPGIPFWSITFTQSDRLKVKHPVHTHSHTSSSTRSPVYFDNQASHNTVIKGWTTGEPPYRCIVLYVPLIWWPYWMYNIARGITHD